MKYFYDTEFIEDGKTIELISIGIVAEDGREFYAQNLNCDFARASDWVKENVLSHLLDFDIKTFTPIVSPDQHGGYGPWYSPASIAAALSAQMAGTGFIRVPDATEKKIEFWAYYADYDHVALCQLFGTMMDLPKGWPMYTRDLKQWCDQLGNPKLPEQGKGEHDALADARWNKRVYDFLESKEFLSAKA